MLRTIGNAKGEMALELFKMGYDYQETKLDLIRLDWWKLKYFE